MTFTLVENDNYAKIKVIGVGGAGGNAINNMIDSELHGVKFIAANTDSQSLETSKATVKIQIGEQLTQGLGAGANPQIGREAALENADAIKNALEGSHMVFITAGFGGGTGTGAAPVIAEICKENDVLTVAVVTKPFSFEGGKRAKQAEEGINVLKKVADTVITIPNDRLRGLASKNARMIDMFKKADEVLLHSVKGITDLIMIPGLINLDFADVKTIMSKAGMAIMGIGIARGDNRAIEAAERAISHPLLEDISISGAKGVLMNITSNSDLTMEEMTEASDRIYNEVGKDAEIIWGTAVEDSIGDEMRVTVIATGIDSGSEAEIKNELRGKVRDITADDLNDAVDYDEPTFIRRKHAVGESSGGTYRGYKGIVIDNTDLSDLDVPTFLRKKAD
ncbi:MAG: cell division protein FtsZ [Deltaproteobacteria bacterium]|nr:cell division protein FtsZ [Deltaproteobacteria bacterium]MBW1826558.1 cell division protein FtsZ [Deltaproteobacteria bacterium]MBW1969572.1 cell division protein FtsZ [Deltaproteobacteria bacterium]MBW2155867.1 cell division protein FtsZ [Deltaproteobacteria bacterium]MBW2226136.1 cell division protein FtsZ [Deltaproteobacteria bacterium]